MKTKSKAILISVAACALFTSSCVSTTTYSGKGEPVETTNKPDPLFWAAASKVALEALFRSTTPEVIEPAK